MQIIVLINVFQRHLPFEFYFINVAEALNQLYEVIFSFKSFCYQCFPGTYILVMNKIQTAYSVNKYGCYHMIMIKRAITSLE